MRSGAHKRAMVHKHNWLNEPPLDFNKSYDERYGDEEDEASNRFWASPDGVQHLQSMLEKDPTFETSPNWPQLVEWCSTCSARRFIRVALPHVVLTRDKEDSKVEREVKQELQEQEQVVEAVVAKDATTQTPPCKRRRSGGKGSRMRRLIAFQLSLSKKHGLPPSRLVSLIKKEVEEKEHEVKVKEEKEKVMPCSAGASTGGQTLSTPRSNQPEEVKPTPEPALQCPNTPPFPNLSSPFYTHTNTSPITYISHPQHFPQFSSPYTPFFIPPTCGGLMPGPQWVLCGACQAWGTIMVS